MTADRDGEAVAAVLGAARCRDIHPERSVTCRACRSWGASVTVAALLPLIREREAAAWESAVQAVAWCLDHGEPSAAAALAYTAKNNPYAGSEGGDE